MKVLWLCNVALPQISKKLSLTPSPYGGWLEGAANAILEQPDIELTVCYPQEIRGEMLRNRLDRIESFGFAAGGKSLYVYDEGVKAQFSRILAECRPDVIHVWGTEYPHSLAMMEACREAGLLERTLLYIQGLVGVYARHFLSAVPPVVARRHTLRDFIKRGSVRQQAHMFAQRGKYEARALSLARHIIGRTDWDRACVERINREAHYHVCNETLRGEFYRHRWSIDQCQRHSIFVSQSDYPIKGFHLMLEAMRDIVRRYPDAQLFTTGSNPLDAKFPFGRMRQTYYRRYLGKLLEEYGLRGHVTFLGTLGEREMCAQYLKAHVFASCSSIENSSNSVGEAMVLGVPVVASDVGGVASMLTHNLEGFMYPFDEPYMLAYDVMRLFGDDALALSFSGNANKRAGVTHDPQQNARMLMGIYLDAAGR